MTGTSHAALDVRRRSVLVVGLGTSGLAAVQVLMDRGARVRVSEARGADEVGAVVEAEAHGADVATGGHLPEHLDGIDLVIASPGVPEHAPVLRWARERGVPIWSELELGARLSRCPLIGVTGTNGKTTTAEMVAAAMREDGLDAIACGNVGYPFSLAALEGHDALAVEASSFQLRFHETFHPHVSVLLNLAPDHLDWHVTFDAYRGAKRRIFLHQRDGDVHVGNRDEAASSAVSRDAPCPVTWFTLGVPGEGEVGYEGSELVARLPEDVALAHLGSHAATFRSDAAAAAAAGLAFGITGEAVGRALTTFGPLPHRGEIVGDVGGIRFIDDSKATNPHAVLASLAGRTRVILVAGGRSKGIDFSPLLVAAPRLDGLVAVGEAAGELTRLFDGKIPVRTAPSIEEAAGAALALAPPGGTVLLAPACASQDMFRDYAERGERFAAAVSRLAAQRSIPDHGVADA